MSFQLCNLKKHAKVLKVSVAIFSEVTFLYPCFSDLQLLSLWHSAVHVRRTVFSLKQLPNYRSCLAYGSVNFTYTVYISLPQSMLMQGRLPASTDALKNTTTFKSHKKGWVWIKKGDGTWDHRNTAAPLQQPHRVGLARQLQALASSNAGKSNLPLPSEWPPSWSKCARVLCLSFFFFFHMAKSDH